MIGGRRAGPTWSEPPQRRSLHSRDSSRPNVLCVQTVRHPRFSRTVRVSCFTERQTLLADGLVCRHATIVARSGFRCINSPARLAVSSDRMRRSPQSTVVFSLYQTMLVLQLPVVVVAGDTRCASYDCRHHQLDLPPTTSELVEVGQVQSMIVDADNLRPCCTRLAALSN